MAFSGAGARDNTAGYRRYVHFRHACARYVRQRNHDPASGATSVSIPVHLVVTSQAQLTLSQAAINIPFTQGGTAPAAVTVGLTSSGTPINFTTAAATATGGNWLAVTPASGSGHCGSWWSGDQPQHHSNSDGTCAGHLYGNGDSDVGERFQFTSSDQRHAGRFGCDSSGPS